MNRIARRFRVQCGLSRSFDLSAHDAHYRPDAALQARSEGRR
jgi:hypothetical protein